jgi:hypothetical protein
MANEREPDDPLPVDFVPEGAAETHRVSDGEDWASVAAQYNVNVDDLIYFNFHTNVPEEVNWYLRRNLGCNVSNDGGLNWAFSSSADPGVVYIPPSKVIEMEPEVVTADKPIMERLREIAKTIDGSPGIRIRKMLEMVDDRPARLWYYTPAAVSYYLQLNTSDEERRGMTKDTNGQLPFDGDLGRGFEQFYHEWRIYPISDIVVQDTNEHQSDSFLKLSLEGMENSIYKSWEEIANVESHFAAGGGSVVGPLVQAFVKHIYDLADTPGHVYYIYQHDEDNN